MEDLIRRVLKHIGDDPNREGLVKTPARIVQSWKELFSGYNQDPFSILKTLSGERYDQIILLKNCELYSMCEHHFLPFFGKCHIAYIPDGKVVGISELARLVEVFSRRLQIQERLGEQITESMMSNLKPKGVACIIEATHLCMRMRGIGKQNSSMITSSLKGCFLENSAARQELMGMI